jgi:polyphosphate kinase
MDWFEEQTFVTSLFWCIRFRTRSVPLDLPSRSKWYAYSRARDRMLESTDTKHAPWHIVRSDDKRRARLNLIAHFLSLIPYEDLPREKVESPKRSKKDAYDDIASIANRRFVPEKY